MDKGTQNTRLAPEIRRKLATLRRRIRAYVWLQGASVAAIWLILTFWIGLAIDYFPVLLGASEMPQAARAVLLAVIALVLAYILYRWILRRIFARLADHSLAILLERQFPKFGESLITAVEMSGRFDEVTPTSRQMLATTQLQALRDVHQLKVARVLSLRPLLVPMLAALGLVMTVGAFYVVNASALELGVQRIYLLDDQLWPRSARIEIVGVEATGLAGAAEGGASVVPFVDNQVKVARGSDVGLLVRSDAAADVVPERCVVSYRTAEGDRGRVVMTRVGQVRDGYQHYRFDGKPLRGILSDVRFDVLGYDHRIREQRIQVVDRPLVVAADIECTFPEYIVDPSTTSWLPRTMPLSTGTRLPRGTSVVLHAASNKELRAARITDPETGETSIVRPADGATGFEFPIGVLTHDVQLEVQLIDFENVTSEDPYRIFIEATADLAPLLNVRLQGVGDAVTPDVIIHLEGTVQDDYGTDRSWIEVLVNDRSPDGLPVDLAGDQLAAALDFRQLRRDGSEALLEPGDKLRLTVKAEDKYNLDEAPNLGVSDAYQVDVVTAKELLAMLETRELGLRQRFEQIVSELKETRDSLLRIRAEGAAPAAVAAETADSEAAATDPDREPNWSLQLLRGQRAVLQSQKSAQETLGVAAAFRDIREQLVNNRVDSEDRQERLETQVAAPLEEIGNSEFPRLDELLAALVATMDQAEKSGQSAASSDPGTVPAADAAIDQTTAILLAMDAVLQNMLKLEGYNELLDLVRSLIADQEQLIDSTKKEQRRQVLEMLQ